MYSELQRIYMLYPTWNDFIQQADTSYIRDLLTQAIGEGWRTKIAEDLKRIYKCSEEDINIFISRMHSIACATLDIPSTQEVVSQLSNAIVAADLLRGYLRYAYLTANDSLEDIFFVMEEGLSKLGTGNLTSAQCRQSYKTLTGKETNVSKPSKLTQLTAEISALKEQQNPELEPTLKRLQNLYDTIVKH